MTKVKESHAEALNEPIETTGANVVVPRQLCAMRLYALQLSFPIAASYTTEANKEAGPLAFKSNLKGRRRGLT